MILLREYEDRRDRRVRGKFEAEVIIVQAFA
jgi:hypothetical protein